MRYFYATLVAVILVEIVNKDKLTIVLSNALSIIFWYNIDPFVDVKQNELLQLYTIDVELEQYDLFA